MSQDTVLYLGQGAFIGGHDLWAYYWSLACHPSTLPGLGQGAPGQAGLA
ncbi:MAG: hypothetical protein MUP04_04185 [Anaerolineae bacterium]|nr:hypothetical protein [Anaerolineae bacterium]